MVPVITIRAARPGDARGIGAVHVAAWRSAYAGVLPETYLANLSPGRQAAYYQRNMILGQAAIVAEAPGAIVGFITYGRRPGSALGASEIETLYVLDDFRDQGLGRRLMHAAATDLAAAGCRSLFLWVLHDNPSRWFYERLGGRRTAHGTTTVAGRSVPKDAYLWDPIDTLLHIPATPGTPN